MSTEFPDRLQPIDDIRQYLIQHEFSSDAHTADADALAHVAEMLGLRVVRERDLPDGERWCPDDCNAPARIEAP